MSDPGSLGQIIYPVMGPDSIGKSFSAIDLSITNNRLPSRTTYDNLSTYIDSYKEQHQAHYAIGGYLEQRNLYGLSDHFTTGEGRDIHLGIDIWAPSGHQIFAPLDGVIHSFTYNDQHLDYGYTVILKHESSDGVFHTLYGHLSSEHADQWQVGQKVSQGANFASLGDRTENGGWPPHLHFQVIKDMGDWSGDYPGVCSKSDLNYYKENCPDPSRLIRMNRQSQFS